MTFRASLVPAVAAALAAAALAGCGNGGGGGTSTPTATTPSTRANAKAKIRQNWKAFFSPSTSTPKKVSLLQNGPRFQQAIAKRAKSPLASRAKAKVLRVKLTTPSLATVRYSILVGGQPALKNRKGTAVLANGTWKVSDVSFCQLLELQGGTPTSCLHG